MTVLDFMATPAGRAIRVLAGLVLIVPGSSSAAPATPLP